MQRRKAEDVAEAERSGRAQACTIYALTAQNAAAGKTTTAVNLAAMIARETGWPVLAGSTLTRGHT